MKRVYDIVHVIIVYHQWIMYCGTKNFEYDITTLTRENVHSERCIQQNTVLSFDDFKVRMRKSYSNVYGKIVLKRFMAVRSYGDETLEHIFCTLI
jgi:hypothetical protein